MQDAQWALPSHPLALHPPELAQEDTKDVLNFNPLVEETKMKQGPLN